MASASPAATRARIKIDDVRPTLRIADSTTNHIQFWSASHFLPRAKALNSVYNARAHEGLNTPQGRGPLSAEFEFEAAKTSETLEDLSRHLDVPPDQINDVRRQSMVSTVTLFPTLAPQQ